MNDAINLRTFGDLLKHGYKLTGHCRPCSRHDDFDLAKLPAARRYVGAKFKCRVCGGAVEVTVSQISTVSDAHLPSLQKWRDR